MNLQPLGDRIVVMNKLRRAEPFGDPGRLFAVAGPEFG